MYLPTTSGGNLTSPSSSTLQPWALEDLAGGRVVSQDADVLEDPQRRFVDPLDLLGGE